MDRRTKIALGVLALASPFLLAANTAYAAKGDQGVDLAKYQGANGRFGYPSDRFAICQIGGYYDGSFIDQETYSTQVTYAIAQGKRAHTYIYSQFSNNWQADQMLNYYLPKIQTPKGSIVALDVESGNPTTEAVRYALQRVKDAGYTAVLYGYKRFLTSHLDLHSLASQYPLWLAEYPDYNVTPKPNYNYFPSFENIGIFQFTSTYIPGGLDGNVDLTGITDNGYSGMNHNETLAIPKSETPAIKAGQEANNTPKSDISKGFTVKVNFSAKNWSTGALIPDWVKGKPYKVIQVNDDKVLLCGVMSWVNKKDVEILDVNNNLPQGVHREVGKFHPNQTLRIWNNPGYNFTGHYYYSGESINYVGYAKNGNYVYVVYKSYSGVYHYVACRENGRPLGWFE